MSETDKRVHDILVDRLALSDAPNNEDNLFDDLGIDSLDAVEVIMECEKEFGIVIPDEDSETVRTVQDVINVVKKQTGEA